MARFLTARMVFSTQLSLSELPESPNVHQPMPYPYPNPCSWPHVTPIPSDVQGPGHLQRLPPYPRSSGVRGMSRSAGVTLIGSYAAGLDYQTAWNLAKPARVKNS